MMDTLKNVLRRKHNLRRNGDVSQNNDSSSNNKSSKNISECKEYFSRFSSKNDIVYLSDERFFQHAEELYDIQYNNSEISNEIGLGVIKLLRRSKCNFSKPIIEIGCGTGVVTTGLFCRPCSKLVIVSDPSPKFVQITRQKLEAFPDIKDRTCFAILRAEDLGTLPDTFLSAIILRSVLHHVLDVEKFLEDASKVLTKGGCLVVEEPCVEGYILMGAIAQFIPTILEINGHKLTARQHDQVKLFVDTMKFYANRKADKTSAEDKHIFRVDELMQQAQSFNLSTSFYPNVSFDFFAKLRKKDDMKAKAVESPFSFSRFFYNYLKSCMQFDPDLLEKIENYFLPYCSILNEISDKGNAPYTTGVFVFQKK